MFLERQTKKNLFFIKKAKEYFLKCSEAVNHINLSEKAIESQTKIKSEIYQVFMILEDQNKTFFRKTKAITLYEDLNELHESYLKKISDEWKNIFLKIEASFETVADH